MRIKNNKGQALIEILVGLAVGAILIGGATAAIVAILRSNLESKNFQAASSLSQELLDDAKTMAEADWHNIYNLSKGSGTQYYVAASGTVLAVFSGTTTTLVGNITYTKFFSIEDVGRDSSNTIVASGGTDDPSTQKITSHAQWPSAGKTSDVPLIVYLTRWRNIISQQTNWSGGVGQTEPVLEFSNQFASSTGIDYSSSTGSIIIQGF
ncbi:MAG: prepilin-type N-terminal cleavage/methylation domain-containing protein [bacterium]|nr:prepilin-type N-terminal cleavage/methylation domain-containing protein [bacterium]